MLLVFAGKLKENKMENHYLGEKVFKVKDTPFKNYTPSDWAMYFIESYGQIDGGHHKQWVSDQIARILNGCRIEIKQAKWETNNGYEIEWRVNVVGKSKKYLKWVKDMKGEKDEDGEYEYDYDEGIAP